MRILLVKTSSLGDVIHNLPVASDIARALPGARIDWLVEQGFADVPRLHPAVSDVIPVAIRRWRKALLRRQTWREIGALRARLHAVQYDAVIDTQGLLKSAWLTRCANGARHGMDAASAREPLAARAYQHCHAVPRELHAVTRNRLLAAAALGYALDDGPDYGLGQASAGALSAASSALHRLGPASAQISDLRIPVAVPPAPTFTPRPYVVLLTATSRDDKLWPESHWVALGRWLHARGLSCRLPAGNAVERERAMRIAAQIPDAAPVPPSSIAQLAAVIRPAVAVVGVDTGLVHLSAALARPTVALYCASVPALTGVLADAASGAPALNLGDAGKPPSVDSVTQALATLLPAS